MKKLLALSLAVMSMVAFAGCAAGYDSRTGYDGYGYDGYGYDRTTNGYNTGYNGYNNTLDNTMNGTVGRTTTYNTPAY